MVLQFAFKFEKELLIPIAIVVVVITVIVIAHYFSKKNRILRELKKTRRKAINSIRENEYVKIIGKAKYVKEPLVAPLSGRKCIYYQVIVEQKADKSWRTIIDDVKFQDFFVQTNTEMAIVKVSDLANSSKQVHLVKDFKESSGFLKDPTIKFDNYLEKHGKKSLSFLGLNKSMRYKEGIIALDEDIAVKGIANWKALNQTIEGYSYSRILTLSGNEKEKLLITDEPEALLRVKKRL